MDVLNANQFYDQEHHAWGELKELLEGGENPWNYIPARREASEETLVRLQVSTRSYLGTIAYETGGMRFDHGWITLLGSGCEDIYGSLTSWNGLDEQPAVPALSGALVVAYDAAGGFFALDTGRFGRTGHIYYFAPDTMEWESTELAYSGFINWLANGDLQQFYETFRWNRWQDTVAQLQTGEVFAYYPPLWSQEGGGEKSTKAPISVTEAWQTALSAKTSL